MIKVKMCRIFAPVQQSSNAKFNPFTPRVRQLWRHYAILTFDHESVKPCQQYFTMVLFIINHFTK